MKNVYKFTETHDVVAITNLYCRPFDSEFLKINNQGSITVKGTSRSGYSWDGCSPKKELFDLVIGTPDGRMSRRTRKPLTYYASMFHDALYQYKKQHCLTRKECDLLFYKMLKSQNFYWSKVYFIGVRLFGWLYGSFREKQTLNSDVYFKKITIQTMN